MLKTILPTALLALSAVCILPQVSATETCFPHNPYDPSDPVHLCVFTGDTDPHCGTPITGDICAGVKVQANPVQVAFNYEDGLVCAYALDLNTCP